MATTLDLYIDQGSDFLTVLPAVTSSSGTVVNLTGYSVISEIRKSYVSVYAVSLTAVVSDAVHGVISLSLPNSETVGLVATRYVYDVVITDSEGIVTTVFEGLMTVNPGVSDKPNSILLTPYVPDDYGGLPV